MICEITPREIVGHCCSVLGIESDHEATDDAFLLAILRRAAGMLCPCSRSTLRSALTESLAYLHDCEEELPSRIEELIDDLIVTCDLLELSDVTTDDTTIRGTWVFAAPPAFIERESGHIFLIGIVPDQDTFLSEKLRRRVINTRNTRFIVPLPGEDLPTELAAEGIHRLTEAAWLKAPRVQSAIELVEKTKQRLANEPQCAPIYGIEVIDSGRNPAYYRGRWTRPENQTGMFVARRPQEFGNPAWCFAELKEGRLLRIIDLPVGTYRWRACDAAWHLQMAIDYMAGRPQRYSWSVTNRVHRYDFYSPLPLWSERRLMRIGRKVAGDRSLFAYEIPESESQQEEQFLKEALWLLHFDADNDGKST